MWREAVGVVAAVSNGGDGLIVVFLGREESVMAQGCVGDTHGCIKRPGNFEGDDEEKLNRICSSFWT
jgi:hypothetical protein